MPTTSSPSPSPTATNGAAKLLDEVLPLRHASRELVRELGFLQARDAATKLFAKVRAGGEGVWGEMAMPPQEEIKDDDLKEVLAWILAGAPEK